MDFDNLILDENLNYSIYSDIIKNYYQGSALKIENKIINNKYFFIERKKLL